MRPLIGISTYREPARWGTWDIPAVLLPAPYADAIAGAGGEPVLLPTGASSLDVLPRLDGLVLAVCRGMQLLKRRFCVACSGTPRRARTTASSRRKWPPQVTVRSDHDRYGLWGSPPWP